jgi:RimJ/RimL family protein N-acetyltransferase
LITTKVKFTIPKDMNKDILSVREMTAADIEPLTQYWLQADKEFLKAMGVDTGKMPDKETWIKMLSEQLSQPYLQKKSYCIIWLMDDKPIGHSNVNKIVFDEEAYMHLHLWNSLTRKKGLGVQLVKMTLPYYFKNLGLKKLYCEPYALNPAPHKTLEKVGFRFVKEYVTTPGWLNFEQPVKLWEMTYNMFTQIQ